MTDLENQGKFGLEEAHDLYEKTLWGPNTKGLEAFSRWGITSRSALEAYGAGYATRDLLEGLTEEQRSQLEELGMVSGRRLRFQSSLVFPLYDGEGKLVDFLGRSLGRATNQSFIEEKPKGIGIPKGFKEDEEVICVNLPQTALRLYESGHHNVLLVPDVNCFQHFKAEKIIVLTPSYADKWASHARGKEIFYSNIRNRDQNPADALNRLVDFHGKAKVVTTPLSKEMLAPEVPKGTSEPEEGSETIIQPEKGPPKVRNTSLLQDIARHLHNQFLKNEEAQQFLTELGFMNKTLWKHFLMGYCEAGVIEPLVNCDEELKGKLQEIGFLGENGKEVFDKRLIVPLRDDQGGIVDLASVPIKEDEDGVQHLKISMKVIFNEVSAKNNKHLIVCESLLDALCLVHGEVLNVVGLIGGMDDADELGRLVEEYEVEELTFLRGDNPFSPALMESILAKTLGNLKALSSLTLPEGYSTMSEFLKSDHSREDLERLISQRKFIRVEEEPEIPEPPPFKVIKDHQGQTTIQSRGCVYRVRSSDSPGNESLKAVITVECPDQTFTDSLNLYSSKSRLSFVDAASFKTGLPSNKIEADLYRMIEHLEAKFRQKLEERLEQSKAPALRDWERKEALEFFKDKNLIPRILDDIQSIGYVGQEREVLLLYASFLSVHLDQQVHVSIQSSSSSGKSEMLSKVSSLFPPEKVQLLSRMSSQALYYGDSLDGKVIILDERSAADQQGKLALRSLMSRGKLSLSVVQKDPLSGQTRTESMNVSAKCCVWDADTQSVSEDNLNRAFLIYLDESSEQTKKIHEFQLKNFSPQGWQENSRLEKIRRRHQNGFRLLKPYKVEIPFCDQIRFPVLNMRSRRDFSRFLNLLACVTLLHQYQRPVLKTEEGVEYLQATLEDYTQAYEMVKNVIGHTYSIVQKESRDLLTILHREVSKLAEVEEMPWKTYTFNRKQVREWTHWGETKVRMAMKDLQSVDLVQPVTGRQGSGYRYQLLIAPEELDQGGSSLTTPEELERKFA